MRERQPANASMMVPYVLVLKVRYGAARAWQ